MQDGWEQEFVEENDQYQKEIEGCSWELHVCLAGVFNSRCKFDLSKVEDDGDQTKNWECYCPSNYVIPYLKLDRYV